jgi:hypothetical protein
MTQPTPGFSSAEIQTAVTSLVQSTISRPIDALGVRRVDVSFNDIQQAAGGIFLLYPNSPFYVVALGANRAIDLVVAEELILVELLVAVQATGRRVLPIQDVSTLFNAQAALQELQSAAAARSASFTNITALPSFQRFAANVTAFLSGPGQAVKEAGQIVQTPQEAQTLIPGLVTQLQAAHVATVAAVTRLAAAIDDFNSLNLPSVVASSVIGNAQTLVGAAATGMSALTPTQRLEQVRRTVLTLLAAQGVVTTFGSFQKPSEFLTLSGIGHSYSDATHPANAAMLTTDFGGAFGILTGTNDTLTSMLDGGSPSSITLAPSPLAALTSGLDESYFVFGDGTQPVQSFGGIPNNNLFKFRVAGTPFSVVFPPSPPPLPALMVGTADVTVGSLYGGGGTLNTKTFIITVDGAKTYTVTFAAPANSTALLAQINAVTHTGSPHDVIASLSGVHLELDSVNNGPSATITIQAGTANTLLGFTFAQNTAGANVPISATTLAGAINGVLPAGVIAEAIGSAPQHLRIRCTDPSTQLSAETTLQVYGDDGPSKNCLIALGFDNGQLSTSRRSTADEVALDITSKVTNFTAVAKFVASVGLSSVSSYSTAQNEVTLARVRATGNTAFVTSTLTFTVGGIQVPSTVSPGDVIVLRDGPTLSSYTISTVNGVAPTGNALSVGDVIVATGGASGTPATGVSADIGAPLPATKYDSVSILSGPNNGTYYISGPGVSPLDVLLVGKLPVFIPNFQSTASYGKMHIVFTSKSVATTSAITIAGNSDVLFFSSPPGSAVGTSSWFLLPEMPRGIQAGDLLQYFGSIYNVPDESYEIIGVDTALRLIQLATPFPNGLSVNFSTTIVVPFGRIKTGKLEDYNTFKADVNAWLAGPVNAATFFSDMNRKINPLLVNTSPTAVQVNDALTLLNQLYGVLSLAGAAATAQSVSGTIEEILTLYATLTQVVPQVDTLIKSFIEKGSDRAVDLLVSGQFSTFFGLSIDEVSYAGTFQSSARAVAMNDLPVRKFNRSEVTTGRLLGQTQSPDYEFPANGVNEQLQGEQVSPPIDFGTPNNFGTTTGSQGAGGNGR